MTALVNRADPTSPVDPRNAPLDADLQQLPAALKPTFVAVDPPVLSRRFPVVLYTAVDYQGWQRRALKRAREIHAADPVDVVHHLSWASLQHGAKITSLGPPAVLGPVGGGTKAPKAYASVFERSWRYEQARSLFVSATRLNPYARATVRNSTLIFASNPETKGALASLGVAKVDVMLDDGVTASEIQPAPVSQPSSGPLQVLWMSRIMERKALGMALDALAIIEAASRSQGDAGIHLTVIGDGESRPQVQDQLDSLEATGMVTFLGWQDQDAIDHAYATHHVLLFNSVRDNGSAPLHEATKWGMPAVVLDHQGPGTITSKDWAVKIPLSNPGQSAQDIADALTELATDHDRRTRMGHAALAAAHQNTWQARAKKMAEAYRSVSGIAG